MNAFIIYQPSYKKWNNGLMEEDPLYLLDQKEYSLSLVKSLCGTLTCCKPRGRPSAAPFPMVGSPGHGSVNGVKRGLLNKGRCHQCALGPNKRATVERRLGCVECQVRLCPENYHDIFHACLAMENP